MKENPWRTAFSAPRCPVVKYTLFLCVIRLTEPPEIIIKRSFYQWWIGLHTSLLAKVKDTNSVENETFICPKKCASKKHLIKHLLFENALKVMKCLMFAISCVVLFFPIVDYFHNRIECDDFQCVDLAWCFRWMIMLLILDHNLTCIIQCDETRFAFAITISGAQPIRTIGGSIVLEVWESI